MTELQLPHNIGRYTLTRCLGQGGMGVVYVAHDARLARDVAIKMIAGLSDERSVKRFWREARAAAAVTHPHVCQIYEVEESPDGVFLAMELLTGEALDARIRRGPSAVGDVVRVGTQVLAALAAIHDRGIAHRDIKPSNIFLTPHGVKLLDFGLARHVSDETLALDDPSAEAITRPGMVVGTPRYMAPEQLTGQPADPRTDIYAVGAVLFEMLAGRPPFQGDNAIRLSHAILHEHPPALQGSPTVVAADRVVRRALAKNPAERYPMAEAMAAELRNIPAAEAGADTVTTTARALLRLIVPPLRMQRSDADTEFLSYGLAEAVSSSLAALRDVVVRAPSVAATMSGERDPRQLASQADVDYVIQGSLSRAGDQLRATLQLVEAGSGTVAGATSVRGEMQDIFTFEDRITAEVVRLLTPIRASSASDEVERDTPATARAFEHFLRGLEHARAITGAREARDCFARALDEDPAFAPAWAWIARCHRVIGKYVEHHAENDAKAEDAFRRALALSPDLPVAHRFYTHFESEHGRADAAIARLLQHARKNRNDAQLFAALVHACRYAGLLGASMAAHNEARRLDPTVPTSAEYTMLLANDQRLGSIGQSAELLGAQLYFFIFSGRGADLSRLLEGVDASAYPPAYRSMIDAARLAQLDAAATMRALSDAMAAGTGHDPEAVFLAAMTSAYLGREAEALGHVVAAVEGGFAPVTTLEEWPMFAPIRQRPAFASAQESARQRRRIALAVFERGGGADLLGIGPEQA